jgi:hypothetical protein
MTKQLTTINPATEEVINTYDLATKEQINEKLNFSDCDRQKIIMK